MTTGNYFYDNLAAIRGCCNPEKVLENLDPNSFGKFLRDIGLTEQDAKTFLIKALNYVEDHKDEFDT